MQGEHSTAPPCISHHASGETEVCQLAACSLSRLLRAKWMQKDIETVALRLVRRQSSPGPDAQVPLIHKML